MIRQYKNIFFVRNVNVKLSG